MPTLLVYDVSGPTTSGREKLSKALRKINCKAEFVESWSAAVEALQEDQGAAGGGGGGGGGYYAAFLCDIKPEGGWSRIDAGGERGTSGWDVTRTLRQMASDDAGAGDAEGGSGGGGAGMGGGGGARGGAKIGGVLGRCKTGTPVVGVGVMNGDETARDPRAATVPVSSVVCHCEEAGMLAYVQKPLTAPKLRTALGGIVPGVQRAAADEDPDDVDPEEEEHMDEALEEWAKTGGWISKLSMIPFRISRYALKRCRGFLPLWMVHILGNAFGVHFKNK